MSVWYCPITDNFEIWQQRMMDEWVFEAVGFYSPQYSEIPPWVWGQVYVCEL